MKNSVLPKKLSSIFAQNPVFWRNKLNDLEPKWVIFLWKWSFLREKNQWICAKMRFPPPKLVFITKKNPESWEKFHSLSNEKLTTICKKRAILCWTGQKEKRNKRAISWNSAEQAPTPYCFQSRRKQLPQRAKNTVIFFDNMCYVVQKNSVFFADCRICFFLDWK